MRVTALPSTLLVVHGPDTGGDGTAFTRGGGASDCAVPVLHE